jgi:transcription elongation GreA/GreB family factor
VNKVKLTQYEYNRILIKFKELQLKQSKLRQSHIDAVKEGDDRECDAWSLTNDLSNLNYTKLKEINDMLVDAVVVKPISKKSEKIGFNSIVKLSINKRISEFIICHSEAIEYIENSLSSISPIGTLIFGKEKGFTTLLSSDNPIEIIVLSVENSTPQN